MGRGLQFVLVLAIATPRLVWPDVVISKDSECDRLLPPQRAGKACHVSSSQMASQLKESQLLPPHINISARVRHELAAHLIRHPEIGMVTCDPPSPGRDKMINLFPYLRATLPITAKQVTCWLLEAQCQCDRRMRHCCSQKHHDGHSLSCQMSPPTRLLTCPPTEPNSNLPILPSTGPTDASNRTSMR